MILRPLLMLFAAAALAEPSALFDGSAGIKQVLPPLKASPIPGSRWSNAAQAARLPARPKAEFSFAVIGDAEPGRFFWERFYSPGKDAFQRLLAASQDENPDFVFQLGDFVSKGTVENYREHLQNIDNVRVSFFAVIGNHDRSRPNGSADKKLYEALRGKTDFYFDYGGWRFIGLDTADRRLLAPQLAWLKEALAAKGRKIIFTHVPPAYLKRLLKSEDLKSEAPPEGYIYDVLTAYFEEGSSEFEALVSNGDVARVYMGHIHAYGAATHKGVKYVLSGCGGSPLYPLPPGYPSRKMAHYISVKVGADGSLEETVHPLNGDSFPIP